MVAVSDAAAVDRAPAQSSVMAEAARVVRVRLAAGAEAIL